MFSWLFDRQEYKGREWRNKMDKVITPSAPVAEVTSGNPIDHEQITETAGHNALYKLFNIEKSGRVEDDFSKIWEYATSQATNKDADSILYEVIRLKNRLQAPQIGEKPYLRVLMYVNEYMKMRQSEQKLGEMTNA